MGSELQAHYPAAWRMSPAKLHFCLSVLESCHHGARHYGGRSATPVWAGLARRLPLPSLPPTAPTQAACRRRAAPRPTLRFLVLRHEGQLLSIS